MATVPANAKLTLTLRITGVRSDGYHLIDAEMVTLDLADQLRIDPAGVGLSASGPFSDGMPVDATNLVARALRLCQRNAGIHVDKHIPHGGGLGGGSADAAAVLRWAGYTDLVGASRLGADVPFCMVGGHARVTGIGEIIDPLAPIERDFTLIIAPLSCSTPAVYRAWDDLGGPVADGPNDLEPAALVVEPRLRRWRDRIHEAVGRAPTLAGSGATWFVVGHQRELVDALPDARIVFTASAR
ncbi:MAG: 4-(cytidine 5'-diphospho)-2-C-methyl-D-erythritol kinase [Actinobacteria bacterium]|nr:4-(cytidine 5'-diphospho)-2-C-methyl-D-erythritol kinase [Actinomycetota bacterium]